MMTFLATSNEEDPLEGIRRRVAPYEPLRTTGTALFCRDFTCVRKQEEVPMASQDSPSFYERLGGVYSRHRY